MADTITLQLFARFRDAAGQTSLELPATETIADLRSDLKRRWPALAALLDSSRFAVDDEFAEDGRLLRPGDRLALIPPVSGG